MESKKVNIELPEGVTQEMINAWKAKYGVREVKLATLSDADGSFDPFDIIVRVPDHTVMGQFQKYIESNPKKAQDILVNGCILHGKEKVKADKYMYSAAVDAIAQLIPAGQATIKNL